MATSMLHHCDFCEATIAADDKADCPQIIVNNRMVDICVNCRKGITVEKLCIWAVTPIKATKKT
jgi:hypothetical protein